MPIRELPRLLAFRHDRAVASAGDERRNARATGYGTIVAEGKETREFDGRMYVLETALKADVSLVKAWKADKAGNLVFRKTARNFNPAAAMAGRVCVVEVEELVEIGAIEPDHVHLPGIYVQRIVVNATPEKRIEQRTIRQPEGN